MFFGIRDGKKSGSGIRDKHPGSATLKITVFFLSTPLSTNALVLNSHNIFEIIFSLCIDSLPFNQAFSFSIELSSFSMFVLQPPISQCSNPLRSQGI